MYTIDDFKILTSTDTKALYRFESNDGKIEANFFFEPGNVQTRGLIHGTNEIIYIAYPFARPVNDPHREPPKPEIVLKSLISQLKHMEV